MKSLIQLTEMIESASTITVLTGAGVSTASGIPDFRSANGLWSEDRSREYYMSNRYFSEDPVDFWKKYKEIFRIKLLKDFEPNPVHYFLRDLEKLEKRIYVITQNVDGLHKAAFSSDIIEYHGSLDTATCPSCGTSMTLERILAEETPRCFRDECRVIVRPDVVLFGDPITKHGQAEVCVQSSELLLTMGTSLQVSPFNLLPEYAVYDVHIPTAIINREETVMDSLFDCKVFGDLSETVQLLNHKLF
ncbi:NAD-dependent protein deacylase [Alkalicoccobacillus murimartini]|uniref:protein acetyllysine N-acetyltransferase n=1 Tax=Alkalicoccobacillus murimartini TaxID=171685 RepID=A0ABT9YJB4_9BACI|nr:NAD-dependent protein deacylase [Alkalicoccobacillus murimartini]MDQ0207774.1 NAD-dependent SIR2 family protein deacetylase [Alkalicoccobacillus murimartini]